MREALNPSWRKWGRWGTAGSLIIFLAGLSVISFVADASYMMISYVFVIAAMIPFFIRFERKTVQSKEIVLIAVLAAIAAIGRVPFAAFPGVQPTTFVIMTAAWVFGAETGFMIGAVAALASNLFLGQGPWTPWQMFTWGMVGLTAGAVRNVPWMAKRWGQILFGFVWGFLFGWIMNLWVVLQWIAVSDWRMVFSIFAASFYFDLAHSLSNVFFLALFGAGWMKSLQRFKRKYGLLDG